VTAAEAPTVAVTAGGDPTPEEVAAIVAAVAAPRSPGARRGAAPLAVLGPVVDQAGAAAPRPAVVRPPSSA
jgi:hypothetical protein